MFKKILFVKVCKNFLTILICFRIDMKNDQKIYKSYVDT